MLPSEMEGVIQHLEPTMKSKYTYRIQYRMNGLWTNGYSFDKREEAEEHAKRTGRDYQIIKERKRQ